MFKAPEIRSCAEFQSARPTFRYVTTGTYYYLVAAVLAAVGL